MTTGGGRPAKKTGATLLREKYMLSFGRDHFLFLVLSLSENKLGVISQNMRKEPVRRG